jgi:uncharacterized NAD(P)/FAD-binding protein YdhS
MKLKNSISSPHFVIIGGGFSGVMLLINMIQQASKPLHITLIEKSPRLAKGIAYGTSEIRHLLNVVACKMGAFADDPQHFYHWLLNEEGKWRGLHPSFKNLNIQKDDYLPRMIYGAYLQSILDESLLAAQEKQFKISFLTGEAISLEKKENALVVGLHDGTFIEGNIGILALGVSENKEFGREVLGHQNYISNLWSSHSHDIFKYQSLEHMPPNSKIAMIGSGLTMLDAYSSLIGRGYLGEIIAISRHGKLPAAHIKHVTPYHSFIDLKSLPSTVLEVLKILRYEIKESALKKIDWRCVVDEFRWSIGQIWQRLSWDQRAKAKKHLLSVWNLHRHRMPWVYIEEIQRLVKENKFFLKRGEVLSLGKGKQCPLSLRYRSTETFETKELEVDYVINCSGPTMNIHQQNSPLVKNLIKQGLIYSDPLNLGIQADAACRVKGGAKDRLFAVGQILFGELLETTAVPDLRFQCFKLAKFLIDYNFESHFLRLK